MTCWQRVEQFEATVKLVQRLGGEVKHAAFVD